MADATHSSRRAEAVEVRLRPHDGADTLSVVDIHGFTCVVKSADWAGKKMAAWIPPDTLADVRRPEFAFLAKDAKADCKARIKAKKLRGVVSYGLLVPVPDDTPPGEDFYDRLGLEHYEPPLEHEKGNGQKGGALFGGAEDEGGPPVVAPKYDLEAFLRYHSIFEPGEPVAIHEKADGCNYRVLFQDGRYYAGSRTSWKKEFPSYDHVTVHSLVTKGLDETRANEIVEKVRSKPRVKSLWWSMLEKTPELQKFCRDNPGTVVYSEIAGTINCIKYGFSGEPNRVFAFDLLRNGHWVDYYVAESMARASGLPWVPRLHETVTVPYDFDLVKSLATGPTTIAGAKPGTIREGCVISSMSERTCGKVGRAKLKFVSPDFLEKYR